MDRNLLRYIWKHTRPEQLWILLVVVLSMPTLFLSLDLPKQIVNGPIQGRGFDTPDAQATFFRLVFDVPQWIASTGKLVVFSGIELGRMQTLFALSGTFLMLVIINGLFKLYINTYKGRLGERMLRRLRFALVDLVLRFPPAQLKRVKPSEVATMVKDEVEPLGGLIGDAFVQPVFLGGQAITAMVFILVQSVPLGLLAGGIVAVQVFLIPRLRRRLIELGRQRQLSARELAGRVGEIVETTDTVHTNDTSNYERADISARLGRIFQIRYELYQRKFSIKFLNNLLAQITPFLFYLIGGYFALRGTLDIGQLVAVIAAYKDLPAPIRDLLDWDQQRIDAEVKYVQVVDQFTVDNLLPAELQAPTTEPVVPLTAALSVSNLSVTDETGVKLVAQASLNLEPGMRVAVVGKVGSGAETFVDVLARLHAATGGRVAIGDRNLVDLHESITGRRVAYASADNALPQGTLRDHLTYVLKHVPLVAAQYGSEEKRLREWEIEEARRTGNLPLDIRADWIDYSAAGASGPDELFDRIGHVLRVVGLDEDVLAFGLRGTIDPERAPEAAAALVDARREFRRRLQGPELAGLVEPFDPDRYSAESTISENLLFGTPVGPTFRDENLPRNAHVLAVVEATGLDEALFAMGRDIAATTIELFRDLPPDHPFFEQLSFMKADEIPQYAETLQRVQGIGIREAEEADRKRIVRLTFTYVESKYRLGLLSDDVIQKVLKARELFREGLPPELAGAIEFYDAERYNKAASILDNILFGRIAYAMAEGPERVLEAVYKLIDERGLRDAVLDAGLDFNAGSRSSRLSASQRQKLNLARALLKRPDIALLNRPLAALDVRAQDEIVKRVLQEAGSEGGHPFSLIWVLQHPPLARVFDWVAVFDEGSLVEQGPPESLVGSGGHFDKLLG